MSRKLRDDLGLNVLALDFNTVQSEGAARRDLAVKRKARKKSTDALDQRHRLSGEESTASPQVSDIGHPTQGSLTYETVLITEASLLDTMDTWMLRDAAPSPSFVDGTCSQGASTSFSPQARPDDSNTCQGSRQIPVLFVALHACGSLTPSILRAFTSSLKNERRPWCPQGAVVAGCCYNLISSSGTFFAHYPYSPHGPESTASQTILCLNMCLHIARRPS